MERSHAVGTLCQPGPVQEEENHGASKAQARRHTASIVIQFGDPSIVLTLVYYAVAVCCVIASRTKRKIYKKIGQ
jgi:hypothetical protein